MYAKEFEDLLKEYLTDGIITSKERQVLLKKAQQLGYNVDEVDLYIDAQQQKCDQTAEAATAKKRGKTCPRCGASVQSMQLTCPECGFEFNNKEANASARELMKLLNSAKDNEKKIEIISNYPIPNTRENLAEFVSLCIGNCQISFTELYGDEKPNICLAWRKLSQQVVTKAYLMLKDDPMLMEQVKKLEKISSKKMPLHGPLLVLISAFLPLLFFFGVACIHDAFSGDSKVDESDSISVVNMTRDQIIQKKLSDVSELVKDNDLAGADEYLTNLTLPDSMSYQYRELNPAYQSVINAYLKDNNYESAESLALIFKGKIDSDLSWKETPVYKILKAKYKATGRDFSALKSEYDSDED
ncbi:hypothetical protein [Prevotellamassilia timonensis]|uniref:hypothetical protein n=1 Tax=Prevotellamassilia timonensis TaxID=1852370 RepID=UPI0040281757